MVPEAGLAPVRLMFNQSARDFNLSIYFTNFRCKKAPTNFEAFLHHSLLLEIIMVPEAGLAPVRLMLNQSARDFNLSI